MATDLNYLRSRLSAPSRRQGEEERQRPWYDIIGHLQDLWCSLGFFTKFGVVGGTIEIIILILVAFAVSGVLGPLIMLLLRRQEMRRERRRRQI